MIVTIDKSAKHTRVERALAEDAVMVVVRVLDDTQTRRQVCQFLILPCLILNLASHE